MYLINYDLYDMHALIVFFRYAPERFPLYAQAVSELLGYLETPPERQLAYNNVRRILRPYYVPEDETLSWVLTDNRYTANVCILKSDACYAVLSAVCREMLACCDDTERLYLLCDAVHNIPLLLADVKHPKKAMRLMLREYRTQYNRAFLLKEWKHIA